MAILDFLSLLLSSVISILVGLAQFVSNILSLPVFLASLFITLPSEFALGFTLVFWILVSCIVIKIYHYLKS